MIQVSPQIAAMLVLAFLGCVFGFGKILLAQFEARIAERLTAIKDQINRDSEAQSALRDQVNLLGQTLPLEYVRREDWIRFSASIDHKLDRLAELVIESKMGVARARN